MIDPTRRGGAGYKYSENTHTPKPIPTTVVKTASDTLEPEEKGLPPAKPVATWYCELVEEEEDGAPCLGALSLLSSSDDVLSPFFASIPFRPVSSFASSGAFGGVCDRARLFLWGTTR